MTHPEQLISFADVGKRLGTRAYLLLGNGFSVACDPVFRYASLFNAAVTAGLSTRAQQVFQRLGTNNFEGAMRLLDDSDWVARTYGLVADGESEMQRDVAIVKETLIRAVADSHLPHSGSVTDERKARARTFLAPFHGIFTTNYDLLTYWIAMSAKPIVFQDGFREDPDAEQAPYVVFSERLGNNKGVFYIHGALHLYLAGGELRKHCWSRTLTPLTRLIKDGLKAGHYPIFVAEGSAVQKLEQIQRVGYLWYCLDKLARIESPLVVYGHSLGPSDQHIADTIACNPKLATVFVGVHGGACSADAQAIWNSAERMKGLRHDVSLRHRNTKPLDVVYFDSQTARVWD